MTTTEEISQKITPILKSAGAKRASLFGSYARGEQTKESDIDVLIEPSDTMTLFSMARLQRQLQEATGTKVDIVTYDSLHQRMRPYVMKDAIEIY
jgi:predicted nucleotidyltransferase